MATTKLSPNADEIVTEIEIAAPAERVFQALVDPKQVVQWWGQAGMYRCSHFESDLRVGGKWRAAGEGGQTGQFEVVGEYLEIKRPNLLVSSWVASWTGDVTTTVRWELEPGERGGTRVTIRHSGLSARPELAQSYRGWPLLLGWLQALLERGQTIDTRK